MKPLTIDELKALSVGDWVWVVDKETPLHTGYYQIHGFAKTHIHLNREACIWVVPKALYGKDWIAYKNKEFAESKGEWVVLPCKVGDPIWVVYRDFDHGFNEYKIYESTCTGFAFEHGTEIRIVTAFCCYDFDRVGNYTDKSKAEARLKALQKE